DSNSGGSETNKTEIYDPVKDKWTSISPPPGWSIVGDAPSILLADGRFMLGSIVDTRTAIYDPKSNQWTAAANAPVRSAEETWTLLPDGTFVTEECVNAPNSDLYDPVNDAWIALGPTPSNLVNGASEIGPGLLLYTGAAFQIGATPHSA